MKNTKHTEMNDSSIEQDKQENLSQSKRKILTSIGVTSGVVGATALVPSTWVKPAVNSIILPAHAESTPPAGGGDTTTTTTEAPAPVAGIVLSETEITLQEGAETATPDTATYMVSLATMPEAEVTVTVTQSAANDGQGGVTNSVTTGNGMLTFDMDTWDTPQEVTVTAGNEDEPATVGNAGGETIEIYHTSIGYADRIETVTVTVVDGDLFTPDVGEVELKTADLSIDEAALYGKTALEEGEMLVNWAHEKGARVTVYLVDIREGAGRYMRVDSYAGDIRTTGILTLKAATVYTVRVTAVFEGDDGNEDSAESEAATTS